jgi:hypothetical protein
MLGGLRARDGGAGCRLSLPGPFPLRIALRVMRYIRGWIDRLVETTREFLTFI